MLDLGTRMVIGGNEALKRGYSFGVGSTGQIVEQPCSNEENIYKVLTDGGRTWRVPEVDCLVDVKPIQVRSKFEIQNHLSRMNYSVKRNY